MSPYRRSRWARVLRRVATAPGSIRHARRQHIEGMQKCGVPVGKKAGGSLAGCRADHPDSSRIESSPDFLRKVACMPPMGRRAAPGDRRGGRTLPGRDRIRRQSFGRKPGEVLHPEREPREMLEQIRRTIAEYNFCRPVPAGVLAAGRRHGQGGVVQELWRKRAAR